MKYLLALLTVVAVLLTGKVLFDRHENKKLVTQLNEQLMQANLELGKAHTKFGEANEYIGQLEGKLQDEIKAKNESLTMYGELLAKYKAKGEGTVRYEKVVETVEVPAELSLNRHHFYWAETTKTLQDLGKVVGPAYFQDHRIAMNCLVLSDDVEGIQFGLGYQLNLKLQGQLAQTTTETGAVNHYLTLWEIDNNGKRVGKFKLDKFEVVVTDARKPEFFWFAPHVDLGVVGGFDGRSFVGGSVGGSLMGYGLTKNDLSWRFARVGMTLAEEPRLELSPFLWNLGGPLPLVSNIWVGPAAVYGGKWGGALLLNVVL